nr:MAG TPA: hypothetical protein [Caudoviricetes sp.]
MILPPFCAQYTTARKGAQQKAPRPVHHHRPGHDTT